MITTLIALIPAASRGRLRGYVALTLVSVLLRAAGAVLLVPLVAALVGSEPADALPWLGLLAGATVLGWAVDAAAARLAFALGFELLENAQHDIAERLTRIRLTWFTPAHVADARHAVATTGPDLIGLVINLVTPLAGALLLPPAIALGLLWVSPTLALAAMISVPLMLGAVWLSGRLSQRADRAAASANGELTERLVEFGRTQAVLRASRRVGGARSQVARALGTQHSAVVRLVLAQVPGQLLFAIVSQVALVALAGTTAALTLRGDLAVPVAVALVVVIVRYLEPLTTIAELAPALESTRLALVTIREVLAAPTSPTGVDETPLAGPPRIELRGVQVRYRADEPAVIDGLDLVLEPGTTTAIVGPSGAGKSTILNLVAGLAEPTRGRVLLDGRDAAELTRRTRCDAVTMVFQDTYLFDGTLEENVRVGDSGASDAQVKQAAQLARVDEITARLPHGVRAAVGEAGARLSGGERQRVSIARALLKPAPVLLVDEATSALDTENERAVVDALTRDPLPRTRVIVAHRLSSIATADRVLFLERGEVVEDGTVAELLAAGGRFATYWQHQQAGASWRLGAAEPRMEPA